jgi:hypothetical protein
MKLETNHPVLMFVVAQLIAAGATYAAIRADLREALVTAQQAAVQADKAHQRIDRLQERAQR